MNGHSARRLPSFLLAIKQLGDLPGKWRIRFLPRVEADRVREPPVHRGVLNAC